MVMLRFLHASDIHTTIGIFGLNHDNIDVAASSANNLTLDCIVVPTAPFNSEARKVFHLMFDANEDATCEQVFK